MFSRSNGLQIALLVAGILWQVAILFLLFNRMPVYLSMLNGNFSSFSLVSEFLIVNYRWLVLFPFLTSFILFIWVKLKALNTVGLLAIALALFFNLLVYTCIFAKFSN
jgi:hypothetical protein